MTEKTLQINLLRDFINEVGQQSAADPHAAGCVLIMSHELSLSGAPVVCLQAADSLRKLGFVPAFLSLKGGPLDATLAEKGIPVFFDDSYDTSPEITELWQEMLNLFDVIIFNSLVCAPYIHRFSTAPGRKAWWVHETAAGFFYSNHDLLPIAFASVDVVWLVSPNSATCAAPYCPEDKFRQLVYGVADDEGTVAEPVDGCLHFICVGSLIPRKGQNILLKAIELLPREIRERAFFEVLGTGYDPDPWPEYTKELHAKLAEMPWVTLTGECAREECLRRIASAQVMVSASNDDPMPVVVSEGLQRGILCICSDAIGQAQLLEHGKEALFFPCNNAQALANAMQKCIEHPEMLDRFREPAKEAFRRCFSMTTFDRNLRTRMEELYK